MIFIYFLYIDIFAIYLLYIYIFAFIFEAQVCSTFYFIFPTTIYWGTELSDWPQRTWTLISPGKMYQVLQNNRE